MKLITLLTQLEIYCKRRVVGGGVADSDEIADVMRNVLTK